jgi:hypothetical protein
MKAALRMRPELGGDDFEKPADGLVEAEVDPESGGLTTPGCVAHRAELFVAGTEPKEPCPIHDSSFMTEPPVEGYDVPPYKQPPGQDPREPEPDEPPPSDRPPPDATPPADRPRRARPPDGSP